MSRNLPSFRILPDWRFFSVDLPSWSWVLWHVSPSAPPQPSLRIPEDTDILIAHGPAKGCADGTKGCPALLKARTVPIRNDVWRIKNRINGPHLKLLVWGTKFCSHPVMGIFVSSRNGKNIANTRYGYRPILDMSLCE